MAYSNLTWATGGIFHRRHATASTFIIHLINLSWNSSMIIHLVSRADALQQKYRHNHPPSVPISVPPLVSYAWMQQLLYTFQTLPATKGIWLCGHVMNHWGNFIYPSRTAFLHYIKTNWKYRIRSFTLIILWKKNQTHTKAATRTKTKNQQYRVRSISFSVFINGGSISLYSLAYIYQLSLCCWRTHTRKSADSYWDLPALRRNDGGMSFDAGSSAILVQTRSSEILEKTWRLSFILACAAQNGRTLHTPENSSKVMMKKVYIKRERVEMLSKNAANIVPFDDMTACCIAYLIFLPIHISVVFPPLAF